VSTSGVAEWSMVLHVDDVGMCHGANVAFAELSRIGAVDAGSVMVPCPGFAEAAALAARDPALDLGVHLTLTSEKPQYRWGPVTRATPASGLVDEDGSLHRSVDALRRHAHPDAVEAEMRAQVERALAAGIDATHLDDHMGATFAPEFVAAYARVGRDFGIPLLMPRTLAGYDPAHNFSAPIVDALPALAADLADEGHLVAERVLETPWPAASTGMRGCRTRYEALFGRIGPGLSYFALHPNAPGEIELIEPGSAWVRVEEWFLLSDPDFREWVGQLPARRLRLRDWRDSFARASAPKP
jgi:chitin disaccharide deacetylase